MLPILQIDGHGRSIVPFFFAVVFGRYNCVPAYQVKGYGNVQRALFPSRAIVWIGIAGLACEQHARFPGRSPTELVR